MDTTLQPITFKQGSTFYSPQTGEAQGTVQYDAQTGAKLATGGITSPYSSQSTTTLSSDKTGDILNANNNLTTLGDKGVRTDTNSGAITLANGSVAPNLNEPFDAESEQAYNEQLNNLKKLQSQADATTADLLANIQQKFEQRKSEQADVNMRQKKGITNALLMGGVTGQGSSAQYAPISSEGIIGLQESFGIKQIGALDAEENDLIAQANAAKQAGDFRLVEAKNALIEKKRQEKIDLATKLNEQILAQNKELQAKNIQAQQQDAIGQLYSQGITDVPTMYAKLKEAGYNVPFKEISDNIALLSGLGGTGIIGEYNYYKSEAQRNGQTPVSFEEYQNRDANRKIKIAGAANAAGLTTALTNTALKLSDDYEARSKDYYAQREAYNRVLSSASDPSAAGDLALIFNYMKTLDPNSTVREGEFATAQNSGSAFNIVGAKYNKIINGERLTEAQRKDFVDRATKLFNGAKAQQDSVVAEFEKRAGQYGVPPNLVVRDTSSTGSNAQDIIKSQQDDEATLQNYITTHPNMAAEIDKKIRDAEAAAGQPLSATDFLQIYPEYR